MEISGVDHGTLEHAGIGTDGTAQLYGFALLASCAASLAFATLMLMRAGLGDSPGRVLALVPLCLLPPWTCAWAVSRWPNEPSKAASAGAAGILTGALLPLAGLVLGPYLAAIALALLLAAVWSGRSAFPALQVGKNLQFGMAVFTLAALFVIFTAPVRIFLPEAMLTGAPHPDAYYHAALAQMVLHYGAFSIGADGLVRHHYHFLSHFAVAGASRATLSTVAQVYCYWGAIGLKLDVLTAYFFAATYLFPRRGAAPAHLIGTLLFAWFAMRFTSGFESESHMLGLAILVASLPLLLSLVAEPAGRRMNLTAMVAIAAMILCAAAKISAGFYGAIALALAAWTHRSRMALSALLVSGLTLLALFTYIFILNSDRSFKTPLPMLAASYLSYISWGTFTCYALVITTILALAWRPAITYTPIDDGGQIHFKRTSPKADKAASLSIVFRRMLAADGVMQFMLLCLLGCLAVLVTQPIGNDMAYFSLPLAGIALVLLPSLVGARSNISLSSLAAQLVIGSIILVPALSRFASFVSDAHLTLLSIQNSVLDKPGFRPLNTGIRASLNAHKPPLYMLGQQIAASSQARFFLELQRLNRDAGGKLAVQVAPEAAEIWKWSKIDGFWCTSGHLIVPAEAGIVEIRSVAPAWIERQCVLPGLSWYGYGDAQDLHRTLPLSDTAMCDLARPIGARQVYRLVSTRALSRNTLLTCAPR